MKEKKRNTKTIKKTKKQNQISVEEDDFVPKAFQKEKKKNKKQSIENSKESKHGKKKPKKEKTTKQKVKRFCLILLLIFILVAGIYLGITSHQWKQLAKDMLVNQNSSVVDTDGKEIAKLGSERKNETVSLSQMPVNLKNAYVAIEDERFYSHHGVDIKRTGSAILSYIFHFGSSSYGGSTITQQLVKNLTGDSTDSITRKVSEWWKAWQLETCLSKEEVLEGYLNIIYVGPNMYGTGTAAKYYFNKSVEDLSLEECAFLAGMNHSPNSYNPFEGKDNKEKIQKRTKIVLDKMLELNNINQEDYQQAVDHLTSGLNFKEGKITSSDGVYSYHTDALTTQLTQDIAEKYYISQTFATNYITMAGLTVQSSQDSKIQNQTEIEFEKSKYEIASKNGASSSEAAMVIIDHLTGQVLGCTGGLGEKTKPRSLNRATQSIRQTGSAIKPIAVLAPAIDKKIITASSIFDDTEQDFADGYHPTDYSASLGKVTVRRAVESSQNIPFVQIMEKLKPSNSISYLKKMGVTTLTKEDNTLVLSLGGLQKGISPLEMAGAYAIIANDGEYIEPTFYVKATTPSGKTQIKATQEKRRVFSKEVAYILKDLLKQPVQGSSGTATYCNISGLDVAAKTGTTDENYDRWLCGFTPYYTAVTWFGFDQNESIEYNQRNPAGLLWANVMSRIHSGLPSKKFVKPNTLSEATVCSKTGKKARTGCQSTYKEYFLWFTIPGYCDEHSGSELKDENTNATEELTNKVQEIVQGITNDIDAKEPPRQNTTNTTTQNTNTSNQTNPSKPTNTTNKNNIVTNTNTNVNTNTNNTNTPTNTTNTNTTNNQTTNITQNTQE